MNQKPINLNKPIELIAPLSLEAEFQLPEIVDLVRCNKGTIYACAQGAE